MMKAIFMLMMVLASPAFGQTATTTATSTPPYATTRTEALLHLGGALARSILPMEPPRRYQ